MRQLLLMTCLVTSGVGVLALVTEFDPFASAGEQDPSGVPVAAEPIVIGPAADPVAQVWNGPAETPFNSSIETRLQKQLLEAVHSRMAGMSPEELRRLIALVETEEFQVPPAAQEILDSYHAQANAVQSEANQKIRKFRQAAVEDLKELLARFIDQKEFEEAVAVRNALRALVIPATEIQADPGTLTSFTGKKQRVHYFRITGDAIGSVWGTGTYTADSDLSTAAVHAGILKSGQTGVIRVTLLPGQEKYPNSTRNGVTTSAWGNYGASYRISRSIAGDFDVSPEVLEDPKSDPLEIPEATPASPSEPDPASELDSSPIDE
ncbi:LCCL domain-containing protein [Thalassoroseus pseudoceratinae]|uniref:LCCL domain-containing protein n=1 Tax=Thalassoroseus pseudoceratinae TaxID=2713176 RepID=UPI00141F4A9A|nr:LCCL domain-containing protein [Thalassoroseus pseudoceratinae]